MEEIEIKLVYKNKEKVVEKLKNLNANLIETFHLNDTYYGLGHKDMSNSNNLIRIRKKNGNSELTFKGKCKNDGNIWERLELSTNIDDSESMCKILENLGFNLISDNESIREIWKLKDLEIAFIDIVKPTSASFLEIEGEKDQINLLKDELKDITKEVGEEFFSKLDEARKINSYEEN